MYYLISQFSGWLLLAVILGGFVGYLTLRRDEPFRWGWLPLGLGVMAVALLLSVFRLVNGAPAFWIETAALFFVLYLLGCCLGGIVKHAFTGVAAPVGVPEWNRNLGDPAPPISPAPFVAGGLQERGVREWHKDLGQEPFVFVATRKAAAGVVAPPVEAPGEGGVRNWHRDLSLAPATPLADSSAVQASTASPLAKVEGEDAIAGARPFGLEGPRGGKADDLKLIRGIGRQNEGRLHALGIWHFDQIAAWTPDNALWVGSYLAFPGRIERESWITQASALAAGQETEFASRVKRGEVQTSRDDGSLGQSNVASAHEPGFKLVKPRAGSKPAGLKSEKS
jgi:predicted flap endonuclease-1-like 5' DNA nuclease